MSKCYERRLDPKYDRIVALIDMDCFYCQVEEKLNPLLKGKPIAVVQYNAWKGGGIIAVNYPARDKGVTRHMRGDEAKQHCPDIELVRVPNIRQKADLSKYRDAGKDVAIVLQKYACILERASVDEAYLDITEKVLERLQQMNQGKFVLEPNKLVNSYAVGYNNISDFVQDMSSRLKLVGTALMPDDERTKILNKNDIKLLIAASIINEVREDVKKETGYDCSAGIAHNKILAKLVCGINKPNKQTILSMRHLDILYSTLPIKKIKGLGGKYGDEVCQELQIKLMSELQKFSQEELKRKFDDKNGVWLHQIAQGIDIEPVTPRFVSKSIGCCKKFPGRTAIKGIATLKHWLSELANEIVERLEKDEVENNRKSTLMTVSYMQEINQIDVSSSRSVPINHISDVEKLAADALDVIRKNTSVFFQNEKETALNNAIKFLGINVGKFTDLCDTEKQNTIRNMFQLQTIKKQNDESNIFSTGNKTNETNDNCTVTSATKIEDNSNITLDDTDFYSNQSNSQNPVSENEKESNLQQSLFCTKNSATKIEENSNITLDDTNFCSNQSKSQISSVTENDKESNLQRNFYCTKSTTIKIEERSNNNLDDANYCSNESNSQINLVAENYKNSNLQQTDEINKEPPIDDNEQLNENTENLNKITEPITSNINNVRDKTHDLKEENFHKSPKPSSSSTEDYKQTYAEFYQPANIIQQHSTDVIDYQYCTQCNKNVKSIEFQIHTDGHVAFQLSQKQRIEYRNQLKQNLSPSNSLQANKRIKIESKSANGNNAKSSQSLDKFFKQTRESNDYHIDSNTTAIDKEVCRYCGKLIEIDAINVHADFHIAKRLQFQLDQQERVPDKKSPNVNQTYTKPRPDNKKNTKESTNNIKCITSFFKK